MNTKLRGKRAEKLLSQRDLAEKLGIDLSTYNRKENGIQDFTLTEIQNLMYYLDCSFEDIFFTKEVANKYENEKK